MSDIPAQRVRPGGLNPARQVRNPITGGVVESASYRFATLKLVADCEAVGKRIRVGFAPCGLHPWPVFFDSP